jgi:2-iminobutanoate/2-iminopropanoate deaminase
MPKEYFNPPALFSGAKYGFSQIVTSDVGKLVFLSGQTPFNAEEQIIGTTRAEQMQQALGNIRSAMEAVGGTINDIVSMRVYIVDYNPDEEIDILVEGLKAFFVDGNPPASTWVGISSLAIKGFLIEIEAIAILE